LKIKAKATARGGATVNNVNIDVTPDGYDANGNPKAVVTIPNASGSYTAVVTVDGSTDVPAQYIDISLSGTTCSTLTSSTLPG
jgi:hypothetical protein